MAKITLLNRSDRVSPNGIEFDEKLKQEIENLYPKAEVNEEIVQRYTIQQLQLQLQLQSKKQNVNKALKNFIPMTLFLTFKIEYTIDTIY